MFERKLSCEGCLLTFIPVRSRVLDSDNNVVKSVHPPLQYRHAVSIQNWHLRPLVMQVSNEIVDPQQLRYAKGVSPQKWRFDVCVPPGEAVPEKTAVVDCPQKTTGADEVRTTFEILNYPFTDNLILEVKIE